MATDNTEILYVTASSLDSKGARVLVREAGAENWIWPEVGIQDADLEFLGVTEADQRRIERFLRP